MSRRPINTGHFSRPVRPYPAQRVILTLETAKTPQTGRTSRAARHDSKVVKEGHLEILNMFTNILLRREMGARATCSNTAQQTALRRTGLWRGSPTSLHNGSSITSRKGCTFPATCSGCLPRGRGGAEELGEHRSIMSSPPPPPSPRACVWQALRTSQPNHNNVATRARRPLGRGVVPQVFILYPFAPPTVHHERSLPTCRIFWRLN